MRGTARRMALAAVPFLLVACARQGDEQPGGVTDDEARQLNDAAEMLDTNSVDLNAVANDQDAP